MVENLFYTGLGCLVAAIVGGGLKITGIFDIPVFSSVPRQLLLAALGIVLMVAAQVSLSVPPSTVARPSAEAGWYGWACNQTLPNCDAEDKLREVIAGSFNRVHVDRVHIDKDGWTLNAVCRSLGMKCNMVRAWNGNSGDCGVIDSVAYPNSGDGSQVAYCVP